MPDPTDRDRELAIKALHNSPLDKMNPRDFVVLWEQVEAVVMEARREGREEGLREEKSGSIALPPDCENLWHYDSTWTQPWCPACGKRDRRDPADQPAPLGGRGVEP